MHILSPGILSTFQGARNSQDEAAPWGDSEGDLWANHLPCGPLFPYLYNKAITRDDHQDCFPCEHSMIPIHT